MAWANSLEPHAYLWDGELIVRRWMGL